MKLNQVIRIGSCVLLSAFIWVQENTLRFFIISLKSTEQSLQSDDLFDKLVQLVAIFLQFLTQVHKVMSTAVTRTFPENGRYGRHVCSSRENLRHVLLGLNQSVQVGLGRQPQSASVIRSVQ